jgi:RHH-type transcriptional regulator, rel operon repressor / antitoxin RelB
MSEGTISVRIASDKKAALDTIAAQSGRDVSFVIDQALNAYLELHAWQVEHIEEGMRQADAGAFASEAEVREAFARWRR